MRVASDQGRQAARLHDRGLPLVADFQGTEMAACVVSAQHSLVSEFNMEIGVFDVQAGCEAQFQPVRPGMGAVSGGGEGAGALSIVPRNESERAAFEAG